MAHDSFISRSTLSNQVYSWLRQQILTGAIKQGEHLSEQAISENAGVSATPVREALRLLNGDGLVDLTGRRGAKVIKPGAEEIRHCFEVRKALECLALREACARLGPEDLQELRRVAGLLNDPVTADPKAFFELDRQFHGFFIDRANNSWLTQFLATLNDFLVVVRSPLLKTSKLDSARLEHIAVAQAVLDGRVDDAEKALGAHIDRVCADVLAVTGAAESGGATAPQATASVS